MTVSLPCESVLFLYVVHSFFPPPPPISHHQQPIQNVNMEEVLNEVAEYKPPNFGSNMMQTELQQGKYVPRRDTWLRLFDPLHTLLRAVHRRDYQVFMTLTCRAR